VCNPGQRSCVGDHLRQDSELLEQLIRNDGLLVIGAEYSLETGIVTFFEGVSDAG
jgi:carbonic anhydrase